MSSDFGFSERARFPVVVLYKDGDMTVHEEEWTLTVGGTLDLRAGREGRFAPATIIDSNGMAWEMDGATKLHGVGPLWGFHPFKGRTIRVRLNIREPPRPVTLDFVKAEVIRSLRTGRYITLIVRRFGTVICRAEALKTVPLIEAASSVSEVISRLLEMNFPERASLFNTKTTSRAEQ